MSSDVQCLRVRNDQNHNLLNNIEWKKWFEVDTKYKYGRRVDDRQTETRLPYSRRQITPEMSTGRVDQRVGSSRVGSGKIGPWTSVDPRPYASTSCFSSCDLDLNPMTLT